MAQNLDFQLSASQYLTLALDSYRKGDIISSARYARKAIKTDEKFLPAYGVLSYLYADEHEYELSNKIIFKAMHLTGNTDDEKLRRQLTQNFIAMDMPDVAMYYADSTDPDLYDALEMAMEEAPRLKPDLYLSYPRGEEYYDRLISRAFEIAGAGDIETALNMLEEITDENCEQASQAQLILYTMKNDAQAVIEFGEKMIALNPDSTAVRCTLANAYVIKDRIKEARETIAPLLEQPEPSLETAFMILPVAVNLDMDGEVVRLIKRIRQINLRNTMRIMQWFSQALYNIGERDEARKIMVAVREFYGEDSAAAYYLKLYAKGPDRVDYAIMLPKDGAEHNAETVAGLLAMSDDEIDQFEKEHNSECDNLDYYVHWAFVYGSKNMQNAILARFMFDMRSTRIIEDQLVSGELSYEMMTTLIYALAHLNEGARPIEFDIVAQDRFKHIRFNLPKTFGNLPSNFQSAVQLSIADIIFTDEEPNMFLAKLTDLIDDIVHYDEQGEIVFSSKQREKLKGIRSATTMVGVLLGKVYEADEPREAVIERYGLSEKLYDKYYNIVFGDDND